MSIWSHRPRLLHLGLFIAAYVLGCAFAKALAIVPGSSVSFWPPGGLFIATLILTPVRSWSWWVLAGCLAEMFAQWVWFVSPLPAALLIYAGNALEAMVGAWLVSRVCGRPVRLETVREVLAFVVLGAGLAPVVSATVGAASLAWFGVKSQTFAAAWPLWWIGDATGILIVAPLTLVVVQNWHARPRLSAVPWIEVSFMGLAFLSVAALALGGYLPFAYIVMPPLLWAAVRFDFKGAAVILILLAVITAAFTIFGISQFAGDPESQRQRQIMLHLFLAVSAFSALIVAAISRQHQLAVLTLRQSVEALRDRELELSQLVNMVPSHVWRLTPDGEPAFFNQRMVDFLGLDVADTDRPGMSRLEAVVETVHPDDAAAFRTALRDCLATGERFAMRYRLRRADGVYRWMSSRADPMRDQDGRIVQWYGVCHDIDDQMRAEEALRQSERQLQEMIDAVPVRIWSATSMRGPIYFNKRYQDYLRSVIPNLDALGAPPIENFMQELVHRDDVPDVQRVLSCCFETGTGAALRFRWREKDGAYRWSECRVEPRRDHDGTVVQWYGVSLDIDDEVRAQEALRRSERQLKQLVDAVPVMIWSTTSEGRLSYVNKRFTDVTGATLEDVTAPDGAFNSSIIHPDDRAAAAEVMGRSFGTDTAYVNRYRQLRRDGSYRWIETRAEALRDESGAVLQWYGVAVDIDDQLRLYSELQEREAKIRRLVDSDIIGIVIWDLDGALIEANDAFLRMVRYEREDLQAGLRWFDMTPPEWQDVHAREEAEELKATGTMQPREKEYFRKDGTRVPVLIGAACFEGQSRQGVAYILDLTERKRAETALRDRERELSQLIDMVPVQIRRLTPQGEPTFFNKRLIDFFGMDVAELDKFGPSRLVTAMRTLVHPDESERLLESVRRSFATGERDSMKYRMRRADGAYRWVDGRWEPVRDEGGAIVQWYAISIDVDDEMRAQEALRQSERRLQQMIDAVPAMIWSTTPDGTPTYVNKRFTDVIGATVEDITAPDGSPALSAIIHPDDMSATAATVGHAFRTGAPYIMQYRQLRRGGSYRWTETRAEALRDESGAILQWYGVSVDIDDLIRAKEALRESERLLWQLVETLPAMIYCATPAGEPTYRSRQLRDFLGFDVEDNDEIGKSRLAGTLDAVIHPHDLATVKERYAHSLSTGNPYALKHRLRRIDGEYRWVETRAAAMRNEEGAIIQWNGICLDIEDQVRAQEELRLVQESLARASQAASLAELSASIAHEVNQPLAAIVANSHACERWLSAQPPNVERAKITAERIIRDANSAADVVSRIRALFRQSVERRNSAALPSVIAEARNLMAEEAVRRRVRMDVEVESGLPLVAFDPVQVQQVLINLIRNGMDAMDATAGDRVLAMRVRRMGDAVQTEISDRGRGVALPDKIFQPFFTTKEHGMGMGLAICRSIVESHGGQLWAEKNEPHGARFIFTLPVEVKAAS